MKDTFFKLKHVWLSSVFNIWFEFVWLPHVSTELLKDEVSFLPSKECPLTKLFCWLRLGEVHYTHRHDLLIFDVNYWSKIPNDWCAINQVNHLTFKPFCDLREVNQYNSPSDDYV